MATFASFLFILAIVACFYTLSQVQKERKRKERPGPHQCVARTKTGERCHVGLDANGLCGVHGRSRKPSGNESK